MATKVSLGFAKLPDLVAFILFASFSCQALTAANEPWISHYRGNIEAEAEMAYLDNFAIQLMRDPNLIGYILVYSGADSCRGEAEAHVLRMMKYLLETRGVPWNRVMWKHAGRYTDKGIEVFHLGIPRADLAKIDFPYEPPLQGHIIPRCSIRKQRRRPGGDQRSKLNWKGRVKASSSHL